MWVQLAIAIVVTIVASLIAPKPKTQSPTADRLDVPSPKLGEPIQVIFGEVWVEDSAISYYGNASTTPIKSSGGK